MNRRRARKIVEFVMSQTVPAIIVDEVDEITDKLMKSGLLEK